MATKQPYRVTVLMAVFNGEKYLSEAIESILNQSYRDFEFLIIDDASTDCSKDIIKGYQDPRIRLVENDKNIGLTKTLNKGLALSKTEFIARLDADDVSHSHRLEMQVKYLDRHQDISILGTQIRVVDQNGKVLAGKEHHRPESEIATTWYLLFGNPFVHSSVMFRRKVICESLGGYDEIYRYNQDFELWSRLLVDHKGGNVNQVLVDFRSNPNSITRQRTPAMVKTWKKTFENNVLIQKSNILRILKNERIALLWPYLWTKMNQPADEVGIVSVNEILELFLEMKAIFIGFHPTSSHSNEVKKITARILLQISRYASLVNKRVCIEAYCLAVKANFSVSIKAFPAIFFGFIFGKDILNKLRNLKNNF